MARSAVKTHPELALLLLLFHPALLVIDFGHFQYNSVMLGFTVLALNFFATGHDLIGAVCFVLSLGFKQMALYYAPAIGAYLIGKCLYLGPNHGSQLFVRLAATTALAFLLLFAPFLPPLAPLRAILDPITRIFPFARGLFEDKVANFWCASDVVLKWRRWLSKPALVRLAALLTARGFAPAAAGLVYSGYALRARAREDWTRARSPTLPLLHYALFTSSMSFFLFSFQVHEKTILLPLLPLTLLLSGSAPESATFQWGVLVNNVAMFSMWPLLKRDGLGVQYIALLALWNRLIGYNPLRKPESPLQYLSIVVFAGCAALHVLELVMAPPARYPDLFPVLNVLLSTPVFGLAWLWSIKRGVEVSWAMGGLGGARADKEEREDGVAPLEKMQDGVKTLRQSGARTQSLGFAYAAQGRKRAAFRTASVDLGVDASASASAGGGDLR